MGWVKLLIMIRIDHQNLVLFVLLTVILDLRRNGCMIIIGEENGWYRREKWIVSGMKVDNANNPISSKSSITLAFNASSKFLALENQIETIKGNPKDVHIKLQQNVKNHIKLM